MTLAQAGTMLRMTTPIGLEAQRPNPALEPLAPLLGDWRTTGSHPLVPGTACFLGYDLKHEIINEPDEELVMLWLVSPAGLENFFRAIGRPRTPGEAAPAPFARPENVVEIERASGMTYTHPKPAAPGR